jgi:hypothetical protein
MATPVPTVAAIAASAALTVTAPSTAPTTTERSSAAGTLGFRARFIDIQRAAAKLCTVERSDRTLGLSLIGHLHERKSTGPACVAIGFDANPLHLAVRFK